MPSSSDLLDDKIRDFLKKLPQESYLDIGAGEGKFGKMINEINPKARVVAVEPDILLPLREYNTILRIKASDLITLKPDFKTDIVIMGDVIEHLRKSEGIDLLNFLIYRSKYIIVKYPLYFPQFGRLLDRHISVWNFNDFDNLTLPVILKETEDYMALVIIKGLISIKEKNVKPLFKKVSKI